MAPDRNTDRGVGTLGVVEPYKSRCFYLCICFIIPLYTNVIVKKKVSQRSAIHPSLAHHYLTIVLEQVL